MQYENGNSPVVYIGEGHFDQRILDHLRKWLGTLSELTKSTVFEVYLCFPRRPGHADEHRSLEAHLLQTFIDWFGTIPFGNRQKETPRYQNDYDASSFKQALCIDGRTKKAKEYKWTLQALKATEETFLYR